MIVTLFAIVAVLGLSATIIVWSLLPHHNSFSVPVPPSAQNAAPLPKLAAPDAIKPIAPQDAEAINAARPADATFDPPAAPFVLPRTDAVRFNTAVDCLAAAVYYEAASEPIDGQRAVAQVVLNRVRHPAFPKSVCGVVFDGWQQSMRCQFSFACDGSMKRKPSAGGWSLARAVAVAALSGYVMPAVGHATHYHANYVLPYWADQLTKVNTLGRHIFYRWPGFWGTAAAFRKAYSGVEVNPFTEAQTDIPVLTVPDDALADLKPAMSAPGTITTPLAIDRAPKAALLADQQKGALIASAPTLIEKPAAELVPGRK